MFARTKRAMASAHRILPVLLLCLWSAPLVAEEPPGSYSSVDASSPTALRSTLHPVIDDHIRFPYRSDGTDTWNILEEADEDPAQPGFILDLYRNASYPKAGQGNPNYEREHLWPNSYGFPNDTSANYPYTDCHALFLADGEYNGSRLNNPFRTCTATCEEKPTVANHGRGGGSGSYPGNSNWRSGAGPAGFWETWTGRRGDVARALFYMDVRYEGGSHEVTGTAEPDLILTDDLGLIMTSHNAQVAYMGELATLLAWNAQDPVDDLERRRNDVVESYQTNRNPFIDHPDWAACLFQGICTGASSTCTPDPTSLCLNNGRFKVTALWETSDGKSGDGQAMPLTADTGYFWFFASTNVEVLIKVLDACGLNQRFWVFAGGLTDVHTVLTVTDTQTGRVRTYTNPQGTPFLPIQDTDAFATCSSEPGDCIPAAQCCKICTQSQACGDTCIRRDFNCQQPRGCACNASEVCPEQ